MAISRETMAVRRFGYGFGPGEAGPGDAAGLMADLAEGAAATDRTGAAGRAHFPRLAEFLEMRAGGPEAAMTARQTIGKVIQEEFAREGRARVFRAATSRTPFFDRLSWFWAGHFAVMGKAIPGRAAAGAFEDDAIRPHVAGRFADMLRASTKHPAMLIFLDQNRSSGPESPYGRRARKGLNENLAREIMELHTLGVGAPYTQADVRQFAELLTGLSFDRETGAPRLLRERAEPGAETVLGRSYGGGPPLMSDIDAALDDLAAHPATARHIAFKLARHFVADAPPEPLVAHVEAAFRASGGDLPRVYEALLEHPASWEEGPGKARQPFDYVAATLRAVGPDADEIDGMIALDKAMEPRRRLNVGQALRRLNQIPMLPPGPQGWPEEEEAWITPQGLSARIDWASRVGRAFAARWDPRDLAASSLREALHPDTRFVVEGAAERWEGIALTLASPEFNRR